MHLVFGSGNGASRPRFTRATSVATSEHEALKAKLDSLTDAHASLALKYGILRSTEKQLQEQAALDRAVIDDLLKEQDIFIRTLGRLTEEDEDAA